VQDVVEATLKVLGGKVGKAVAAAK